MLLLINTRSCYFLFSFENYTLLAIDALSLFFFHIGKFFFINCTVFAASRWQLAGFVCAVKRDKSRDEKENGPRRGRYCKVCGVDLPRCPAKSGCHWYSGRIAKAEATVPRFYPSFRNHPVLRFSSPPSPSVSTTHNQPPLNPLPPTIPSLVLACTLAARSRHAHSDLIQFPINSQSIDSNSVYRAAAARSGPACLWGRSPYHRARTP